MAMNVPTWGNAGVEPSAERKTNGFSAGENLPADYLNWFINQSFTNLQEAKTQLTSLQQQQTNTTNSLTPILANMQKLSANMPFRIKCGRYTGTGTTQTVNIGFTPVIIIIGEGTGTGDTYVMYTNAPQRQKDSGVIRIQIVDNGFTTIDAWGNVSGYVYYYLAFYRY